MPASPMATSAAATTMGPMPSGSELDRPHADQTDRGCWSHRHRAGRDVGHRPDQQSPTEERGQPRRQAATRRQQRSPEAEAHHGQREGRKRTGSTPARSRGKRRPANCPAAAPVPAAAKAAKRSWRNAGPRSAAPRSTGAMRTWRTSGASTASGPPRLPDRRPDEERERGGDTEPGGPVGAHPLDPGGRQRLVADHGGRARPPPRRPTIPTRYTWYSASIQWIFATRCRRRARRRSPMTETGTGSASGTTPGRAR